MRRKRLWAGLCSLTLIALLGTGTALAATTADNEGSGQRGKMRLEGITEENRAKMEALTEEQRADMEALAKERQAERETRLAEQNSKWAALTEAEKQQIYDLQRQQLQTQQQLVDKYYELGLVGSEEAERMQSMLAEQLAAIENGDMTSFMGIHRGGAGGIPKGEAEDGFSFTPGMHGEPFTGPQQDI